MADTDNDQSTALANLRLTPPLLPDAVTHGSPLYEAVGRIVPDAAAEASTILRFVRVPSDARISRLQMAHGTFTSGAADIGVYFSAYHAPVPAKNATVGASATDNTLSDVGGVFTDGGGTNTDYGKVVDADFFASAWTPLTTPAMPFDGVGAATTGLVATNTMYNLINESTTNTLTKQLQPLWQAVGLNGDPGGFFDICLTVTTAFSAGTEMAMKVHYTQ